MNISAAQHINFKSNTPVYHAYNINKDNTVRELTNEELQDGPMKALVRRLNKTDTDESYFFSQFVPDFAITPIATSTSVGSTDKTKATVIYGIDALNVNELREDSYVKERYTSKYINVRIKNIFVLPFRKRTLLKSTNIPIGLVLHTRTQGDSFKLENVDIVDTQGKKLATMYGPDGVITKKIFEENMAYEQYCQEKSQTQQVEEFSAPPEDIEDEFEDTDRYLASFVDTPSKTKTKTKLIQGDLFEGIA